MLEAARLIVSFTEGITQAEFEADLRTQSAVERQLEIMGEAARRVSESLRRASSQISWAGIIGQRNVLAHQYAHVQAERIWAVVQKAIPELIENLAAILPPEEGSTGVT